VRIRGERAASNEYQKIEQAHATEKNGVDYFVVVFCSTLLGRSESTYNGSNDVAPRVMQDGF